MKALGVPNVTAPGPETLLHVGVTAGGVGRPSSVAMPTSVTDDPASALRSGPAFTEGGTLPVAAQSTVRSNIARPFVVSVCDIGSMKPHSARRAGALRPTIDAPAS